MTFPYSSTAVICMAGGLEPLRKWMSQYGDIYFLGLLEDSLQCTRNQTLLVKANPQAEGGALVIMPMPSLQSACCNLPYAESGLCSPLPTVLRQLQVEDHTNESNSHQKYTKMYVQQLIACSNTGAGEQNFSPC